VHALSDIVCPLLKWYGANARDLPWRRTSRPYAIWVSEIMLQQTLVATVIPYWKRWLKELPSIRSLANAKEDRVLKLWEGLGYYRRARNLQKGAQTILTQFGGRFPRTLPEVLQLPGVGRYTAGAICSIAFNQPAPIVDGNVIRVLTRVYGIGADPKEKPTNERIWSLAEELVRNAGSAQRANERNCSDFNQALMELGAMVCSPTNPACHACPLRRTCVAKRDGRQAQLPNLRKNAAATPRKFKAFVVESSGRFLIRRRPQEVVNGGFWEFPNYEPEAEAAPNLPAHGEPASLCVVRHSITRYRITVEAVHAKAAKPGRARKNEAWKTIEELDQLALTSAHRKILGKLMKTTPRKGRG
jgi:A/G-specific adenine glycosylase